MERNLKLTIEQAQKIYKEQPEMRELLLTTFTKEELVGYILKDWEDLNDINGYYISASSNILQIDCMGIRSNYNRNIFATEKQAKSALAMAQLSQFMKDLGDECDIDWEDAANVKYTITRQKNTIISETYYCRHYNFLTFKTVKIRDAFMKKHKRLIKDYFMID